MKTCRRYNCDHPYYDVCTLYLQGNRGIAVIQQKFNSTYKCTWWGALDKDVAKDIYENELLDDYLAENAKESGKDGLYPTITVRQLMGALKMKPLKKQPWETRF